LQLVPDSFAGLVTTGLYLHDCSLTSLVPDVLDPLNTTLRYLWLNGNELDRLDRRLVDAFSRLNHIRLGSNPLRCGCESVWLKRFYDRHAEAFRGAMAPSCLHPYRLRGRLFSELTLHDLRCQAPTFTALEAHFFDASGSSSAIGSRNDEEDEVAKPAAISIGSGVRLRCAAVGDPVPTLYWIRPNGKTTRYDRNVGRMRNDIVGYHANGDEDADTSENEAVLELSVANRVSSVGGADDSVVSGHVDAVSGTYTCIANNEAGNVTLTVAVPAQRANSNAAGVAHKYFMSSTAATSYRITRPANSSPSPNGFPSMSPQHDPSIQSSLLGDSLLNLRRLQLNTGGTKAASPGSDIDDDPSYRLVDSYKAANRSRLTDNDDGVDSIQHFRYGDPASIQATPARFSSSDLVWAVVGTHLATLVLCSVVVIVCRAAGGMSGQRSGGWFSIYHVSSSRRRNNRKSSTGSSMTTNGIGGVAACRALKAAYDRHRLPTPWSAAMAAGGGSRTDCSVDYEGCETTIRPAPSVAADSCSAASVGLITPSAGHRLVAASHAEDEISETMYLNGVHRYALPSYTTDTTDTAGRSSRGTIGNTGLTPTTYTTFYGKR